MKRYCITRIKDDLRIMTYPHNSRGTYKTEREAKNHLIAIIVNNHDSAVHEVLGDVSAVEIKAIDCYQGGDPKQTVFN